ncbi:MAG: TIGR00282 family metallophosphoesterase [Acutalibacteraceae bacterium]
MRVLCVGDVVGSAGCAHLRRVLPPVKRQYGVDVCIVNGENAADGNGITPAAAQHIFDSGADVITGGNHTFRRREYYESLDRTPGLLRPANFPSAAPGGGLYTVDKGRFSLAVINLMGVVYMEPLADPFDTLDRLLEQAGRPRFCVVDFHAEATAEKKALAFYADGRVSAVFGTHTHVATADEQILPNGTGFITDVGMTGPVLSVLGVRPEQSIEKMHGKLPVRFAAADGPCMMNAVLFTLDDQTGHCVAVERLDAR